MNHFHTVLLFLHFQTDLEPGVGPDLLVHHPAWFLRSQNHMHAKGAADPGNTDQIPHEIRTFFFQFCKFIHDDHQGRQIRQFQICTPVLLIGRQMHHRL